MSLSREEKDVFTALVAEYAKKETVSAFRQALEQREKSALLCDKNRLDKQTFQEKCHVFQDAEDDYLFRFDKEERLGKTLSHALGAFYILDASSARFTKEISALLPEKALVLDLCAAPGGKSIGLKLRRTDVLLFANDISRSRALEMAHNVERMGLCIPLLSVDPLSLDLPPIFDAILLDAPCSGSGMIRKEEKMAHDWSRKKMESLLPIQQKLLQKAYALLKPEGILAYATCSLSKEEDEDQIETFLNENKDASEIIVNENKKYVRGKHGIHLLPGTFDGEGFYFAFVRKGPGRKEHWTPFKAKKKSPEEGYRLFQAHHQDYLVEELPSDLVHLPFLKPGIRLYDASEHPKFPFDHDYCKVTTKYPTLALTEEEAIHFLRGEEIRTASDKEDGIYVLTYDGLRISFAKKVQSKIKNYLNKGLRQDVLPDSI